MTVYFTYRSSHWPGVGRPYWIVLLASLLALATTTFAQTRRYVSPTGTNTNPATATSWSTATADLQGAINSLSSGEVWVARGIYKPTTGTDRTISFSLKNNVAVYGGFMGSETSLAQRPLINPVTGQPSSSTLSGDIGRIGDDSDNSYHVFYHPSESNLDSTAVADGFIVTKGNANAMITAGGGIYNLNSSPTLTNCSFLMNAASTNTGLGGGVIFAGTSNSKLSNCLFEGNSAKNGGGVYIVSSSRVLLTNCRFVNNAASSIGSVTEGGAIYTEMSDPILSNCSFLNNSATSGGGLSINNNSHPILTNCSFLMNTATYGGGLSTSDSNPILTNCSFQNNSATDGGGMSISSIRSLATSITNCGFLNNSAIRGGGMYLGYGKSILTNCSFQNNSATDGGVGYLVTSDLSLINCVLFGNGGVKTFIVRDSDDALPSVNHSLLETSVSNFTDDGNNRITTANPFVSTTSFQLNACSPAINAGSNSAAGLSGVNTDLAGNPRIFGGKVDMGAYEFQENTIALTNPGISTANLGQGFSQRFAASRGITPYRFDLVSGSLPTGLSLATTGVLSGTPTQAGSFSITVQATDANGCVGTSGVYRLTIIETILSIRYVKPMASGSGDGSSWNNASSNLQAMINATGVAQVWVAAGTYKPTTGTDRTISFSLKNGVAVYGGFTGSETSLDQRPAINPVSGTGGASQPSSSTLSGDIGTAGVISDNSYHVLYNDSGLDNSAVLDGFIITGGNASEQSGSAHADGGGMHIRNSSPTIVNCSFLLNVARSGFGGGISVTESSSPSLSNCLFQGNSAQTGGGGSLGADCIVLLTNCSIQSNTAFKGGGVFTFSNGAVLTNCSFENNSATYSGGGMQNLDSKPILINTSILHNSAGYYGGGIYNENSQESPIASSLTNCSFLNNSANRGGAMYNFESNPILVNCSFQNNIATDNGGGIYNQYLSNPSLTNCVLFDNGGATSIFTQEGASMVVRYSLLEASSSGFTNGGSNKITTANPFVSTSSTQLNPCSPAINAGTNSATGLSGITTDLAGNPRFYNGGVVDMGAYEYQGNSTTLTVGIPSMSTTMVGQVFSQTFTASGGGSPYNFSMTTGSLPTGLSLAATGVLSGTPTQTGSFSITIQARDANGCVGIGALYSLMVTEALPTISGLAATSGTVCVGGVATFTATVANVTGSYNYTLSQGTSSINGTATSPAFSQTLLVSGSGSQSFSLTVSNNGQSALATTSLMVGSHPDYQPLVDLYNSTNGPGWTNKTGWLTDCNPCGWYGVTCTDGRVTSLRLTNNNLTGIIPESLGSLTNLQQLRLYSNYLSGSIPSSLGNLTNLTEMFLYENQLSGPIPASVGNLVNLQALHLDNNQLNGPIPPSLGNLTNLRDLRLFTNQLNGTIPESFGRLTNLTSLNLAGNQLTGCYPASLTMLCGFTEIYFGNNSGLPGEGSRAAFRAFCATGQGSDAFVPTAAASAPTLSVGGVVSLSTAGGSSYQWLAPVGATLTTSASSSVVSASLTATGTHTFTVVVSQGGSCSQTAEVAVTATAAVPTISGFTATSSTVCAGSVASFSATLANISGGYNYTLTNGSSPTTGSSTNTSLSLTQTVSGSGVQSFSLIVSTNGQSTFATTNVTVNALPTAGLSNNGPLSCTLTSVTLTATGGDSYTFANGSGTVLAGSANTRLITTSGTYSVTVANASGCVSTTTTTVLSATGTISVSNPTTANGTTGAAFNQTFTPSGGQTPHSFSLASGTLPTGLTLSPAGVLLGTPTQSGSFPITVQATDANGCVGIGASYGLTVIDPTPTISNFTATPDPLCQGSQVTFTATIGNVTGTYTYTLTNGIVGSPTGTTTGSGTGSAFSQVMTANDAGFPTYTLTVNSQGRIATETYVLSVAELPTASLEAPAGAVLTCSQPTLQLLARGGDQYSFSGPGIVSQDVTEDGEQWIGIAEINQAGVYSVTVGTGEIGCYSVASLTITEDTSLPIVNITPTSGTLTCASPSVVLTANGTGSYLWSTGATSQTINATSGGTYSVTLTGTNGCSAAAAAVEIFQDTDLPSLNITSATGTTLTCANPTITLTANGTGAYLWSTGATSQTIAVTSSATYSVTLTASGGCTNIASVSIGSDQTTPPLSITASGTLLTCGSPTASLTVLGTGDVRWSTGSTDAQLIVSSSGTYSVTLTAPNGCSASTSITIDQDTNLPSVSISPSTGTPAGTTLSCASPSVVLTANGTGSYLWNTGATSQTITATSAGTYSVTLTAENGCSASTSVLVEQGADQTIGVSQPPASSSSVTVGSNVAAQVVITGPASTFQWYKDNLSQPLTSQTSAQLVLTNVQLSDAGSYFVVVSGPCNSLTSTAFSLSVTNPVTSLSLTASVSPNPIQTGQSATLTATVLGGTGPYSYSFAGPGTINPSGNTATVSGLSAGVYSFTVKASDSSLPTNQQATSVVSLTVNAVETAPFAITAVTTISCSPITPNRFSVSFDPRYSGLTGQPISFSVANEMLPTTQPGPYTLQLYTDNATIILQASQQGTPTPASFSYNWLEACRTSETPNTPPSVVTGLSSQTAKVGDYFTYVLPEGTFTDAETPLSLRLSATNVPAGLSFSGTTLSGVPSTTVGSPVTVSITATDPGGLSISTPLILTILPATGPVDPTAPFAITGVSTISCTPIADRININFAPLYTGLNGQPIAFEIVNERAPTTDPAPYSLTLYRDNPVITLRARQTGSMEVASFSYNWLAACSTAGQDNTPPRLNSPVGSQTATVGKSFHLNLANTFADQETPNQLTLTANGLPAGLVLVGTAISGAPSVSGVSTVMLTATDGGGLTNTTSFELTVSPAQSTTTPPAGFAITGVQTLSCVTVSSGLRSVTFQPQYAGVTGQPISFRVENELATTTASGPYSLNLYTDNPTISLKATQSGSGGEVSYAYNWLAACTAPARLGVGEPESRLAVVVLGNPVEGDRVEVDIRGASNQWLKVELVDQQGKSVSGQQLDKASQVERLSLPVGPSRGLHLLRVWTAKEQQLLKVLLK